MRKTIASAITIALATAFVASCSGQSQQGSAPQATPHMVALTNPTDFPLIAGSKVIDVKPFSQTINAGSGGASALTSSGAGTYSGQEVLAETSATDEALRTWVAGLKHSPPSGYAVAQGTSASVDESLKNYGVSYAAFVKTDSSAPRGVVVVAMDPKLVSTKVGFVIDLVDKFRSLPESMRKPLDDEMKAKTGMSATEATDPSAPLGITLAALQDLGTTKDRAIVLIDASKKP